jgi:hypothetical protein
MASSFRAIARQGQGSRHEACYPLRWEHVLQVCGSRVRNQVLDLRRRSNAEN